MSSFYTFCVLFLSVSTCIHKIALIHRQFPYFSIVYCKRNLILYRLHVTCKETYFISFSWEHVMLTVQAL
jgi:hypothetical protein